MIHVSDLSWTRKINHPTEVFKKNDEVEAEVIDIDKTNQRISLGIKQLSDDPWKEIDQKYKIGDLVTGKVTKLASFGAFVQLQDDIDGLVHISQFSEEHVTKVKDILKVGQEVEARVIKVDKVERRIGLSIKAANYSEEELLNANPKRSTVCVPAKTWLVSRKPSKRPRKIIGPARARRSSRYPTAVVLSGADFGSPRFFSAKKRALLKTPRCPACARTGSRRGYSRRR